MEKIKKELKEAGFKDLEYLGEWEEYKVYYPVYEMDNENEVPIIGLPLYVLKNDDEVRFSNDNECFKIMNQIGKE
jgi:hypothetical protein